MSIDDWNPGVRLAGFVAVLAVVLAAAFGIGTAVGPLGADDVAPTHSTHATYDTEPGAVR